MHHSIEGSWDGGKIRSVTGGNILAGRTGLSPFSIKWTSSCSTLAMECRCRAGQYVSPRSDPIEMTCFRVVGCRPGSLGDSWNVGQRCCDISPMFHIVGLLQTRYGCACRQRARGKKNFVTLALSRNHGQSIWHFPLKQFTGMRCTGGSRMRAFSRQSDDFTEWCLRSDSAAAAAAPASTTSGTILTRQIYIYDGHEGHTSTVHIHAKDVMQFWASDFEPSAKNRLLCAYFTWILVAMLMLASAARLV